MSLSFVPRSLHFKVPHGIFLHEATSCAVDPTSDDLYVFNRGNVPVVVFSPDGDVVRMWGNPTPFEGIDAAPNPYGDSVARWRGVEYLRPHSVRTDAEGFVWLVDDMGHSITKCDRDGKRIMALLPGGVVVHDPAGKAGVQTPAPRNSGGMFNRPTDVAIVPPGHPGAGDIFVADGYGNTHIHHLTADGRHIATFGGPGTDAGKLSLPHHAVLHPGPDGQLLLHVADRENSRVQAFSTAPGYAHQGSLHAHRAVALASSGGLLYVAEHGAATPIHRGDGYGALDTWTPHIGHRIRVLDTASCGLESAVQVTALGAATPGERPGQLNWPHSVAVDSAGSVYAAEVSFCECGLRQAPHAREMVSLRKWVRGPQPTEAAVS